MEQILKVKYPEILYIILFGSRAKGNSREASDFDISVLFDPGTIKSQRATILFELAPYLCDYFKSSDVDISSFNDSSILLRWNVISFGKLIYMRESRDIYTDIKYQTISEYIPYAEFQRKMLKHNLKSIRINNGHI